MQLHESDLAELGDGKGYINASMIFDSNPEQPVKMEIKSLSYLSNLRLIPECFRPNFHL